jgi:hypothetical protein
MPRKPSIRAVVPCILWRGRHRCTGPHHAFVPVCAGRKVGKRCKTLTRGNRKKPKCTIPNVRGTLTVNAHAGTNKVRFQGRLSRTKKLKPGRYTLTITATDSAGNRSNAKTVSFTIVRG